MKIQGIGVISKQKAIKSLGLDRDKEGREALRKGMFTPEEIGTMYKLQQVKKVCRIGDMVETFARNYRRIPDDLKEKLTPEELAELVEAFYKCYGDGKNAK